MPVYGVYTAASPFNESDLPNMDFAQTADVIYLAHQDHNPTKIIRHGHTDWQFLEVTFSPSITAPTGIGGTATTPNTDSANSGNSYFPQADTYIVTAYKETTGQESRASSTVTLNNDLGLKRNYNTVTWSAVTGATEYRLYKSHNQRSYGFIGRTSGLTFRDDNIGPDFSSGPPIAFNPFAGANDKPATLTFHEQRSWWGCTRNRPDGLFSSRSADYENMDFSRPTQEDDQITIGLVGNKVNSVNCLLSSDKGLLAFTSNNVFMVEGANGDYITATPPPQARPKVKRGAAKLRPVEVDSTVLFKTARGEVRVLGYDLQIDNLKTDDVTVFSRHLFEGRDVVSWAYAEKPSSCVYAVLDDGTAVCLVWDEAQQVWGWTRFDTDGEFLKVCVIFEQGEDRAYFLVKRTILERKTNLLRTPIEIDNYYIERMASELWEDQADACYLDCAKSWINDVPITTFDRIDHLEGKTVVAWVDGSVVTTGPDQQPLYIADGSVALPYGGKRVTIGLPFTAEVETLPLAMQTGSGWNVAKPQEAQLALARVIKTRNLKGGIDRDHLYEIKQRENEIPGDPMELFTGDMEIELEGIAGSDATSVFLRSDDPVPMHIAAVLIEPKFGSMV
jgi:hypothetical protein